MIEPLYFGQPDRALCGFWHATAVNQHDPLLICAPLLQDGIVSYRSLWVLAESLSTRGMPCLRFNWFGSGDSAGSSEQLRFESLLQDLKYADQEITRRMPARKTRRILAIRSAALPVLQYAAASDDPLELWLWEPELNGAELVTRWQAMHKSQLSEVGRYLEAKPLADDSECLGFKIDNVFLAQLAEFQTQSLQIASTVTVYIANPSSDSTADLFVAIQRAAGLVVKTFALEGGESPSNDPHHFERQWFPRRSIAMFADKITTASL